ncbi:hypothetical protein [Pseudoroseicyclus tamaricis]|uniref:Uncharacterized protein n=1 Tax=Pseudoroseicyclus tamaricis TaxID=2705421 RepID=A0A6B2JGV1_9RHOB|nr:hypothetical protein [Pseudoroseicyclus tamaricis]NDV00441.1 hypothetical protein [Pseudoroseicyclus tamaricis]
MLPLDTPLRPDDPAFGLHEAERLLLEPAPLPAKKGVSPGSVVLVPVSFITSYLSVFAVQNIEDISAHLAEGTHGSLHMFAHYAPPVLLSLLLLAVLCLFTADQFRQLRSSALRIIGYSGIAGIVIGFVLSLLG